MRLLNVLLVLQVTRNCFADTTVSGDATSGLSRHETTTAHVSPAVERTEPLGPPTFPPMFKSNPTDRDGPPSDRDGPSSDRHGPPSSSSGPPAFPSEFDTTPTGRPVSSHGPSSYHTDFPFGPPGLPPGYNYYPYNGSASFHQGVSTSMPDIWLHDPSLFSEDFSAIDFIKSICPQTQSCQELGRPDSYNPPDSCCIKCECSDECVVKGNCCHDKVIPDDLQGHETPMSHLNESCVFPAHGYQGISELLSHGVKSVLMVASCPDNNSRLAQLCQKPEWAELQSIMELSPLYSATRRITYFNKYCADCNTDSSFLLPWENITLSCFGLSMFSLLGTARSVPAFMETLMMSLCVLEFNPPTNDSTECVHQDAIVSDCADTSLFTYNPKIREYCRNITAPFGRDGKIYKNMFCFGCNEFTQAMYDTSCHNYHYGYGFEVGKPEAELDVTALEEGLFSTSEENENEINMDANETCQNGSEYNQYLDKCIICVCAPSKVRVNGTCVPVLKALSNVGLDYKVTYRFLVGTKDTDHYKYEDKTVEAIYNESVYIGICAGSMKTHASLKDYHVTYANTVTRVVMEMTNIEEEYVKFRQRITPLLDQEDDLETSLDHEGYKDMNVGVTEFVSFLEVDHTDSCPESIAMVDLQFCDAVMFRIQPEQIDRQRNLQVKNINFKPSEYLVRTALENGKLLINAHVCKDFFTEKIAAAQDTKTTTDSGGLLSRACTLKTLCIVFLAVLT